MIIPRYDQWSDTELMIGDAVNVQIASSTASPAIKRTATALLALIRAERARRALPSI